MNKGLRNMPSRFDNLVRFYEISARLEVKIGGARKLSACHGAMDWPQRGVYFFMEEGENRTDTGQGKRIVRVGAHALEPQHKTRLWNRLAQHKSGNHRGSIFRLLIGTAIMDKTNNFIATWEGEKTASEAIIKAEHMLEQEVSKHIGEMSFLWLAIEDEPDNQKYKMRAYIENNSIRLLSNWGKPPIDPPSNDWLGRYCNREKVRKSGLWNQKHVDETLDGAFLDRLESLVG